MSADASPSRVAAFSEVLRDDGAHSVIQYGSSLREEDPSDIDLLAIYPGEAPGGHFELGFFDVVRLPEQQWNRYRTLLDPVYATEPILTGEFLHIAPHLEQDGLRSNLSAAPPDHAVLRHMMTEGVTHYSQARTYSSRGRTQAAAASLSFAVSYFRFGEWYAAGNNPVPLTSLRDQQRDSDIGILDELGTNPPAESDEPEKIETRLDKLADYLTESFIGKNETQ